MSKSEFVRSQPVNSSLAEAAWEEADGDPGRAEELLEPAVLWLKGRLGGAGRGGMWLVRWSCEDQRLVNVQTIVLKEEIEGGSPMLSPDGFRKHLEKLERSSNKLEGPGEKLQAQLEEAWEGSDSPVARALEEEDYSRLPAVNTTIVEDLLDFNLEENEANYTTRRKIDQLEEDEEKEVAEDEELVLPCEILINPVKGVSMDQLSKGDKIYARHKQVPDGLKNKPEIKEALEEIDSREDEDGKFPVELISGKKTGERRIVLKFEITSNVLGRATCGKDVGVLAPESTARKSAGSKGGRGWEGSMVKIGLFLFFLVLLVVLGIYLF